MEHFTDKKFPQTSYKGTKNIRNLFSIDSRLNLVQCEIIRKEKTGSWNRTGLKSRCINRIVATAENRHRKSVKGRKFFQRQKLTFFHEIERSTRQYAMVSKIQIQTAMLSICAQLFSRVSSVSISATMPILTSFLTIKMNAKWPRLKTKMVEKSACFYFTMVNLWLER